MTPEQELVVATVRGFVENELFPLEAEVERLNAVPRWPSTCSFDCPWQ